jgi:alpha-beta hydrolase superfamily lysophospholipase
VILKLGRSRLAVAVFALLATILAGCGTPETLGPPTLASLAIGPARLGAIGKTQNAGPPTAPATTDQFIIADDGIKLPLRTWLPPAGAGVKAAILAVHGFNDYSNAFATPGEAMAENGIATYAYDQRGFGQAPDRNFWPGRRILAEDLATASRYVRTRHPGAPLYLLGESMGGAVVIVSTTGETGAPRPDADGVILVAPAVWARETQPWYQPLLLDVFARVAPDHVLYGRGLKIYPSDNIEMLRALARDPLVIKGSRVDTLYGLVDLMDAALASISRLDLPTLYLYGDHDQLVPKRPTKLAIRRLLAGTRHRDRVAFYRNGWHMLLRDLDAAVVYRDIESWIADQTAPLPSGADAHAAEELAENATAS